jgi:hypothetical protein
MKCLNKNPRKGNTKIFLRIIFSFRKEDKLSKDLKRCKNVSNLNTSKKLFGSTERGLRELQPFIFKYQKLVAGTIALSSHEYIPESIE